MLMLLHFCSLAAALSIDPVTVFEMRAAKRADYARLDGGDYP